MVNSVLTQAGTSEMCEMEMWSSTANETAKGKVLISDDIQCGLTAQQ